MADSPAAPVSADPASILEPHRRELQLLCYRMTGSLHDAEDLVQETMVRAWEKYSFFRGESSVRTWLYRIAANLCLDALRRRRQPRRLRPRGPASDPRSPVGEPTPATEWLEPYPDSELPGPGDGPEDQALMRERVSLAFSAALQLLPPRQRAVLILADVLDWRTREIGALLGMSEAAVQSALHRGRVTLARQDGVASPGAGPAAAPRDAEDGLLARYLAAWHAADVDALVELLRDDATLSMPPFPSWYEGRQSIHHILSLHPFGFGRRAGWRLAPTRANGQPAFVLYRADEPGGPYRSFGIMVLSVGSRDGSVAVSSLAIYKSSDLVARFGFPAERHDD